MSKEIAGLYKDYLPRLPIIRAPGVPLITTMSKPSLEQLLELSAREKRIEMEKQRLPSPAALSMFMS